MRSKKTTASGWIVAVVLGGLLAADGHAQQLDGEEIRSNQPVRHRFQKNFGERHDQGLLVRLGVGVGYAGFGEGEKNRAGVGVLPELSIGWVPWEGTALHGSSWGVLSGGEAMLGAGPGVTHYFSSDKNLWLGAKAGPAAASAGRDVFGEWGLSGELEIGVGGWIGDRWSLGGSLVAGGSGLDIDGNGREIGEWHAGLRMTVVFN